jgi:hypothetical protein
MDDVKDKDYRLSFLDVEYLRAFIDGDTKKLKKLRRAGAKVKIPSGYNTYWFEHGFCVDIGEEGTITDMQKERRKAMYKERKETRRMIAQDMLEGREHKRIYSL